MREEGSIDVTGGRVWYRREGGGDRIPLLILHGGPGAASYYVEPLAERLAAHRPTIVYDQLGGRALGRSRTTRRWRTLDRSCAEVDQARAALGLERL